jgi:hypothetical protein
VVLQLTLVVIVIFVPESVLMFLDKAAKVDLDKVQIELPDDTSANPDGNAEASSDNLNDLLKGQPAPAKP